MPHYARITAQLSQKEAPGIATMLTHNSPSEILLVSEPKWRRWYPGY
jgi:hypothetical protein